MIKSVLPLIYLGTFVTFRIINWNTATLWISIITAFIWCFIALKKLKVFQSRPINSLHLR